ncbi:hypothetical protein DYY67_0740 [Candidatus Nitrosotalea sp. TS]|nr:hypothetical protein [Candidatus Nitrosotalea sp. TS]
MPICIVLYYFQSDIFFQILNNTAQIISVMNCKRCHHTDSIHEPSSESHSFLKAGKCLIPNCTCKQYLDPIDEIDEELV